MKLKEAPWKESYNKPRHTDIIKKQTHHFTNKGPYSQNYGFSSSHVQMWELNHKDGWAQKNWYFWTVVLENSWVPWTASSNQSILKEINSEYSLEGLMLKLQHFGLLMQRAYSLEKSLKLGKIEGRRRKQQRGGWDVRMASHQLKKRVWANSRDSEGQGSLASSVHGVAKSRTRLSSWTRTLKRWLDTSMKLT